MDTSSFTATASTRYELFFHSLFDSGRGFAFPCNRDGQVDIDRLSTRARSNYLHSRMAVGRELATPVVQVCEMQT